MASNQPKSDRTPKGRPPKCPDAHRYVARFPPQLFAEVQALAERADVPINDLVVLAVQTWLDGPPRPTAKALRARFGKES